MYTIRLPVRLIGMPSKVFYDRVVELYGSAPTVVLGHSGRKVTQPALDYSKLAFPNRLEWAHLALAVGPHYDTWSAQNKEGELWLMMNTPEEAETVSPPACTPSETT